MKLYYTRKNSDIVGSDKISADKIPSLTNVRKDAVTRFFRTNSIITLIDEVWSQSQGSI